MSGTSKGLILLHLLFILVFTDDEKLQVIIGTETGMKPSFLEPVILIQLYHPPAAVNRSL